MATIAQAPAASRARAVGPRHMCSFPYPAGSVRSKGKLAVFFHRYVRGRYAGFVTIRSGTMDVFPAVVVMSELGTPEFGGSAK